MAKTPHEILNQIRTVGDRIERLRWDIFTLKGSPDRSTAEDILRNLEHAKKQCDEAINNIKNKTAVVGED